MNCIKEKYLERPSSHKLVRCRDFLLCLLVSVGCLSCVKPAPPRINPPRTPSGAEAGGARSLALGGNIAAINTMIAWALERTPLDDEGDSETVQYWKGMAVHSANRKGIKTYYAANSGVYRGRIAKEQFKP